MRWFLILLFVPLSMAQSGRLSVEWTHDKDQDISSYVVEWGTSSGTYTESETYPRRARRGAATGLADCTTHYLVVTAHDSEARSNTSNELSGWPDPRITSVSPDPAYRGAERTLTVTGANWTGANPVVTWETLRGEPRTDLSTVSETINSCTVLEVVVDIDPDADPSPAVMVVTLQSGAWVAGLVNIAADPDEGLPAAGDGKDPKKPAVSREERP